MFEMRSDRRSISNPTELAPVLLPAFRWLRRLLVKGTRRQQAREMLHMSDALLHDIGLTRGDIIEAATSGRDPDEVLTERRRERLNRNGRLEPLARRQRAYEEFGRRVRFLSSALTGAHWSS